MTGDGPDVTAHERELTALAAGAVTAAPMERTWRIEVQKRGKYWQWRTGRNGTRVCRYGGTWATLGEERQAEYERNVEKRNARNGTAGTRDVAIGSRVLSTGGDAD